MSKNFKTYMSEEIAKSAPQETNGASCKWGETKPAKATFPESKTDGHKHRYVIDAFGYGRTDEVNENNCAHWHLITDWVVSPDGTHTHELGPTLGTCGSLCLFDANVPEMFVGHEKKD